VAVPGDLGIVGVGDTFLSRMATIPITSIQSTPNELAQEAVRLVRGFWLDPDTPHANVLMPAELQIRESTSRTIL
jgi:DNA-binding LacI/PurR family transcriptional regulator